MYSSDEGSDNEGVDVAENNNSALCFAGKSMLKPKLDSIFAEVEKNLPSIDFDLSDVSSDSEEPVIFQRHLMKTYLDDDDKDFDTSLNEESLSELFHNSRGNVSFNSNSVGLGDNDTGNSTSQPAYDNDLALQIQKSNKTMASTGTGTTSWTEVVIEAREDAAKFSERPQVKHQNWLEESGDTLPDLSNALSMMESEMMRRVESQENLFDNSTMENDDNENVEKHEKESNKDSVIKTINNKTGNPKMDKYLQQESRRDQEREIVSNMVSSKPLKLNMGTLGSLDIDMVLDSMNEDNQFAIPIIQEAWPEVNHMESVFAAGEGSNKTETKLNENKTLIERLAEMSMEESGIDLTDVDPNTGAQKGKSIGDSGLKPNNEQNQLDGVMKDKWGRPVKRPPTPDSADKDDLTKETNVETVKKTSSCGTNTADTGNQPPKIIIPRVKPQVPETSPKKQEPDTVFLDLRNFDKTRQEQQENIERVQRILNIKPDQNGESSDDDDVSVDCWRDVRNKMKTNLSSKGVSTEVLPDKPTLTRTYKDARQPQRVINMIPQTHRQGDSLTVPTPGIQDTEAEARMEAEKEEKEKRKKMEEAKKLREQRESERQARVRLCKRLNALRPQASVSGKQDSAETTPVVFDVDVSYEPAPRSLPTIMQPEQECLLLTVHLSSNGEIILHRGKSKSVDTGIGLSASYTVLLTWLMSFVPDNYNFLQPHVAKENDGGVQYLAPPFYVVGLQQLWLDEQHALVVAVTPTEQFRHKHIKHKKSKVKDEVKDSSPFQQHLAKFLSTNTLHTVCPWLQDLVSGEVPSSQVDPATGNPSYVYRPPLPNITNKPLSTFMQINPDHSAAQKVFNTSVGFFFQTVDNEDSSADLIMNDSGVNYDTQNTMSLIYKKIFQDPRATMGIFNRVLQEGLDLAGVRLLYPTPELLNLASGKPSMPADNSEAKTDLEMLNNIGPVLAVCIRGTFGRTIWLDAVGPSDPSLARRTDPNSLCALYGGSSRDECLLFCPRNQTRVHIELTRWFGGRVPPGGVIDVGTPYTKKDHHRSGSPKGRKGKKVTFNEFRERDDKPVVVPSRRPPATLTATTKSDIFLVMSPSVGPRCIGIVMATCQRRGYQIRGIRRSRLTTKKACSLGIESEAVPVFCPGTQSVEVADGADFVRVLCPQERNTEALLPCTLLLLEKENAAHHAASLIEACMVQLTLQGIMGTIQKTVDFPLNSKQLFHAARYSDGLQAVLGGDLSKCVDYEISVNPSFVVPKLYTNPEVEEMVVLLILGHNNLKSCGLLVGQLSNMVPYSKTPINLPLSEGFELLGIKWVPSLTLSQAKEVTPYEVGDRHWKKNIHTLTEEPGLVLVLRGIGGFEKLNSVINNISQNPNSGHIDYLMSHTPEEAYSFARSFFTDRELFADPQSRSLLPYLPSVRHYTQGMERGTTMTRESIFDLMQRGPQPFTTLLLIKPRAVRRHLSKILKKIVQEKFHITGLRMSVLDRDQAASIVDGKDMDAELLEKHLTYLTSGPCVYLTLERENAVKYLLDLLGPMDPQGARRLSQFYWRGVFGVDPVLNALHASKDYLTAVAEQKLFFPEGLCCATIPSLQEEQIECPAEDTTIALKFYEERDVLVHEKHDAGDDTLTESMHQLLLQTTCVVLKPGLVRPKGRRKCGYADVIDGLLSNGFEIVGARMLWFTQKQAEHYLHVIQAGSFQQVPLLTSGPCLVLALERDNAVVAFDSQLGSSYGSDSVISQYGEDITRPGDLTQAHNMLRFFFNELMPGSQVEIVSTTAKK